MRIVWQQGNVREITAGISFHRRLYRAVPPTSVRAKLEHPGGVCPTSADAAAVLAALAIARSLWLLDLVTRANAQPTKVQATMIGPSTVSTTLPTA